MVFERISGGKGLLVPFLSMKRVLGMGSGGFLVEVDGN
jgi:hypothetical protein